MYCHIFFYVLYFDSEERGTNMMKVSIHNGQKWEGNPNHNCRNYDLNESPHVIQERVSDNVYDCVYPEMADDFEAAEKRFYEEHFAKSLEIRNEKARKSRKKDRIMTMDQFRKSSRYRPTESIIQIGNLYDYPDPELLATAYKELESYEKEITKGRMVVLNSSLHLDESTPHIHQRKVFVYKERNPDGTTRLEIGKEKALEQAGIPLPFADEPESRFNNRLITYTAMIRDKFCEICKSLGLEIDKVPMKREHLSKMDFINKAIQEERERARRMKKEHSDKERQNVQIASKFSER